MQIVTVSPKINNSQNVTFTSAPIKSNFFKPFKDTMSPITTKYNGFMDTTTTKIAKKIIKILERPFAERIITKVKDVNNIVTHFTAITSVVLSGFYIKKTLDNKKLDDKNKKTLAINQAAVTVLSAGLSYAIDTTAKDKVKAFTKKFLEINDIKTPKEIKIYKDGIKTASMIIIFMTIYRFIAPVIITPFANYIGHKLHENEQKNKISEAK
ncbi:MAG: hypothetical protein WCG95_05605 [bacterium]